MRLSLLALLLAASPAFAQQRAPVRIPVPGASAGPYRVQVEREGEERAGGQTIQRIAVKTQAAVRVDAAENGRPRETWTYGPVEVDTENGVVGPRLGAVTAFGLLDSLRVVFDVDGSGQPRRLLNGPAVRAALRRAVRADENRPGAFASLQAVALREDFRDRLTDAEALADLVLDEPRLLRLVTGLVLRPGQTLTDTDERESPLTSALVRTTVTVRLDSLSGDRATAYLAWRAKADREALVESILAVLEANTPGEVDPTFVRDLAPTLLLEETATFAVDLRTGRVRRAEYEKTARVAGRERIERAVFRRVEAGIGSG